MGGGGRARRIRRKRRWLKDGASRSIANPFCLVTALIIHSRGDRGGSGGGGGIARRAKAISSAINIRGRIGDACDLECILLYPRAYTPDMCTSIYVREDPYRPKSTVP